MKLFVIISTILLANWAMANCNIPITDAVAHINKILSSNPNNTEIVDQNSTRLDLRNLNIKNEDLNYICVFTRLKHLDIGENPINKLPNNLPESIENLQLAFTNSYESPNSNPFQDLSGLSRLNKLKELNLDGTFATDYTPVFSLPSLEVLHLHYNGLTNLKIEGLESAAFVKSLKYLWLDRNTLEHMNFLENYTNLEEVQLPSFQQVNLTSIHNNIVRQSFFMAGQNVNYELIRRGIELHGYKYEQALYNGFTKSTKDLSVVFDFLPKEYKLNEHNILYSAISNHSVKLIRYLTPHLSSTDVLNEGKFGANEESALSLAVQYYQLDIVIALIEARADINYIDDKGRRASDSIGKYSDYDSPTNSGSGYFLPARNKDCISTSGNYFPALAKCNFDRNIRDNIFKKLLAN